MKLRSVAACIIGLTVFHACESVAGAQNKQRDALIVGITGDWATDPDSYVESSGSKQEGDGNTKKLDFLRTIKVSEKTCLYGTGGHLALQFGEEVTIVICKPTEETGCSGKALPRMTNPVVCSRHVDTPKAQGGSILLSLAAIIPWFREEGSARFITPVSRGMDPELRDAVVKLTDGKVDLSPAFGDLEPGSYKVRLQSLGANGTAAIDTAVNWQEGRAAIANVPGLLVGLYRATRVQGNETTTGADAWLLVCDASQFAAKSADYTAAVETTRQWPPEVDARAPQAVLRAYLETLSRGTGKEAGR
jgi:hypothetical protein